MDCPSQAAARCWSKTPSISPKTGRSKLGDTLSTQQAAPPPPPPPRQSKRPALLHYRSSLSHSNSLPPPPPPAPAVNHLLSSWRAEETEGNRLLVLTNSLVEALKEENRAHERVMNATQRWYSEITRSLESPSGCKRSFESCEAFDASGNDSFNDIFEKDFKLRMTNTINNLLSDYEEGGNDCKYERGSTGSTLATFSSSGTYEDFYPSLPDISQAHC